MDMGNLLDAIEAWQCMYPHFVTISIRQRVLFNVLRAFSNYDEEVGYCQGMSNVVATLVLYFEEEVKPGSQLCLLLICIFHH